jgi:nicotinate dehydrogenase subunit A
MPQNIAFTVNGRAVAVAVAHDDTPLLDVLRNELRLTGTRFGCGLEQCGCCIVLIDGKPEKSCGRSIASVAGRSVTTVEGLGTPERPHVLQQTFLEEQAGQCGYCLSGILVSAKALLDRNPSPTRADVVEAISGNICRCTGYEPIINAVLAAAAGGRARA